MSVPLSRLDTAEVTLRHRTGMTTTFWMRRSFIRMKWAARFTGSISDSAAFHSRSYSSFRHRGMLRPAHLFSFDATSHEQDCSMNRWGSGLFIVVVYIWMSVYKWG